MHHRWGGWGCGKVGLEIAAAEFGTANAGSEAIVAGGGPTRNVMSKKTHPAGKNPLATMRTKTILCGRSIDPPNSPNSRLHPVAGFRDRRRPTEANISNPLFNGAGRDADVAFSRALQMRI